MPNTLHPVERTAGRPGRLIRPSSQLLGSALLVATLLPGQPLLADPAGEPGRIAWFRPNGPSVQATQLWRAIDTSDEHGFNPQRYGRHRLQAALASKGDSGHHDATSSNDSAAPVRGLADEMDRAFRQLLTDLDRGVVDPSTTQHRVFAKPASHDIETLYRQVQRGDISVEQALATVTPMHRNYSQLRATLRTLLDRRSRVRGDDVNAPDLRNRGGPWSVYDKPGAVADGIDWADDLLNAKGERLRPGARHPAIMTIKRRLIGAGALPAATVLTPRFDAALLTALKQFQAQNGMPESGQIDTDTLNALALSDEEAIARIVQSLERWRWMPDDLGERYLLVNLPNYRLEFFNGPQRIIDMPVVIGKARRGTPVFSRDMKYIEFSPTWTVPARIAERELLPIEQHSPGYLASRDFQLVEIVGGRLVGVPDSEMNAQNFARRPFPYLLQQKPGRRNALGRMKFMMPNRYAIYLHDTPAKHLFGQRKRAYSHGCIRLEDPDRLASLMLQIDGKSLDEIDTLLAGTQTTKVNLRTAVPTHLVYITTWVDDAGVLQHRPDVYGLDAPLREALMTGQSILKNLRTD